MRHFIAYHNTERMGQSLFAGDPLTLFTNKHVKHLSGNTVWFVTGEGADPRRYSLGSRFVVTETGQTGEGEFRRFARGDGRVFRPAVALNGQPWFADFFKTMAHFSVGVQE